MEIWRELRLKPSKQNDSWEIEGGRIWLEALRAETDFQATVLAACLQCYTEAILL